VLLHQTVIGQETQLQLEMADVEPDILVGCTGGGSNFAGFTFPFLGAEFRGGRKVRVIAAEPTAAPSLTRGIYAYDYGDTAHMAPMVKMHTLGSAFMPDPIHAGGLRYHGMAPLVSLLKEKGAIEAVAIPQRETFERGVEFTRTEGILPAPEANHAIAAAVREALIAKAEGKERVIVFNNCGHGFLDLAAYENYLAGKLEDLSLEQSKIEAALNDLPKP